MASLRSRAIWKTQNVLGALYARRARRYPALTALMAEMHDKAPDDLHSTGVSDADFLALYEAVLQFKPRAVLELGAGRSSAVIASVLPDGAEFVAVEESPQWIDNHRKVIPPDMLARMSLIQRDVGLTEISGTRCEHYLNVPLRPYEFVHVDGPSMQGAALSCDVIDLLPHLGARCMIVFDGREASARFAAPHLIAAGFRQSRHPFTWSYVFTRRLSAA